MKMPWGLKRWVWGSDCGASEEYYGVEGVFQMSATWNRAKLRPLTTKAMSLECKGDSRHTEGICAEELVVVVVEALRKNRVNATSMRSNALYSLGKMRDASKR